MEGCRRDWNKAKKKITRYIAILQRDLPDIFITEYPTKHIFIGNAGLTTNADESSLVELITSVGCGLEALTLLPGKQYSFASFTTPEQARTVMVAANGHLAVRGSTSPVYMAYTDKVPLDPSPIKFRFPPGLSVLEDFVTPEEELQLMNLVDWGATPLNVAQGSVLKHRQVRHFGYEFQYSTNCIDKGNPLAEGLPSALDFLLRRIVERGCMPCLPDQLTINRYLPGQGIPPHVDTHSSFMDELLSLSLGSGINMDFRYAAGSGGSNGSGEGSKDKPPHYVVYLPSRSLCVMTGPARYEWSHGICPRMTDVVASRNSATGLQLLPRQERISFTFRKIRQGECSCKNRNICDSCAKRQQQKSCCKGGSKSCCPAATAPPSSTEPSSERSAARLEREYVLQVYNQIAEHFSVTRHKPWPQVLEFVMSLPLGSMLLDVGCGNGKYMGHNKQVFQAGCDTSLELMKICNTRGFEVLTCNCLHLPYRDSLFDAVVCIAVIHHLATEGRRLAAVREMVRVLSVGGRGLIYVWAMEQQRGDKKSTYLKQSKEQFSEENVASSKHHHRADACKTGAATSLPVHVNRTEFVQQDMLVPWKLKPPKKYEARCERKRCDRGCGVSHSCRNKKSHDTCDPAVDALQNTNKCCVLAAQENVCCDKCHSKVRKRVVSVDNRADQVFHRYYHVFKQGELEQLCSQLSVRIVKSYYDEGNWCIIFQKVS